jgi:hypothetical protein
MALPRLTLISVANPWMVVSPAPLISHSLEGLPGRQFSATIGLAGVSHGPKGADGAARLWSGRNPAIRARIVTRLKIYFFVTEASPNYVTDRITM